MQHKRIVHLHQFRQFVLLEANEALQGGRLFARAPHTVDDVTFLLLADEQNVEHFHLTLTAVV